MLKLLLALAAVLLVAGLGYLGGPHVLGSSAAPSATATPVTQGRSSGGSGNQTAVDITEDQLTSLLQQRLVGQPLGETPLGSARLTSVSAQLRNGQLYAAGSASVGSTSVPVDLDATLGAQDSRAVVAVQQAHAAGMPVPESLRQHLQQSIQDQVDAQVSRLGLRVQTVTITDHTLHLVGTPTP